LAKPPRDIRLPSSHSSSSVASLNDNSPLPALVNVKAYLNANNATNVCVTAIADPLTLWVQIKGDNLPLLDKLNKDMTGYYANALNSPVDSFSDVGELKIGQLVAAMSLRGTWQRAEIKSLEIRDNETLIDIFYVDYGDSDFAKLPKLRKLKSKFLSLSLQAVECGLADIEIKNGAEAWTDEAHGYFEELCYDTGLRMEVTSGLNEKKLLVKLYEKVTKPLLLNKK
jgi:hypothetical protein